MAYLANRGDDMEMRHLKLAFDLGRTRFVFYSPRDRESVKNVIADADVVVNLIGKYYETGQPMLTNTFPYIKYRTNYSFRNANVDVAYTIADVCREMQVDHLVHVSSASASPTARSEWSRTKYEGELAVREAFPWATIIRPTQMFGYQDRFLNWFANCAKWYRCIPLVDGGTDILTQPVWVGDVAKTILRVCDDAETFAGRDVDCFGPNDFSYHELATFVNQIVDSDTEKPVIGIPYPIFRRMGKVMQWVRDPLITADWVDVMSENFLPRMAPEDYAKQTDEKTKVLTMADFGITAEAIEKEAFLSLHGYRKGGRFHRMDGYH